MLHLVKGRLRIYSTDSASNLIRYIKNRMSPDEIKNADLKFNYECGNEYGGMYHLCLLDNCEALDGVSLYYEI